MESKPAHLQVVIDATNASVGRIGSYAAKQALLGKDVIVVNCNHAIVTGQPRAVINEYDIARKKGGASLNGPFFPKSPERVIKRTTRGMLNYKFGRGGAAYKKLMCYNALPKEYESAKKVTLSRTITSKFITLQHLCREI